MGNLIEMINAGVLIDGKEILKNINWTVKSNENWAVIGRNGSGKSFLLRLLSANLYPSRGRVRIFGKEFGKVNLWDLKNKIGFVSDMFQRQYDQNTRVSYAVYSGFFSSNGLYEDPTESMTKKTDKILKFLNLSKLSDAKFGEISYGEQKRVLIARALVFNPKILVFDEPCTGLDVASREMFLETIEKLVEKEHNIIFVTHHIEEVIPAINKVLFMKDGMIAKTGDKKDMITRKNLSGILDYNFSVREIYGRYWLSL